MKRLNQNGAVDLLLVAVLVIVLAVGGFVYYRIQNTETASEIDDASVATVENTDESADNSSEEAKQLYEVEAMTGVSVEHDSTWSVEKKTIGGLVKTVDGNGYGISFSKRNNEALDKKNTPGFVYAENLEVYKEIEIDSAKHYVITSSHDVVSSDGSGTMNYAYISTCKPENNVACSPKLEDGYLWVLLSSYVPNAQQVTGLDFTNQEDGKILDDFVEIMKTLKY